MLIAERGLWRWIRDAIGEIIREIKRIGGIEIDTGQTNRDDD